MDVTSASSAEQLESGSATAPVLRDPAQLLQMYRDLDKAPLLSVPTYLDETGKSGPKVGVIEKAVFMTRHRQDGKIIASSAHGIAPKCRGLRGDISGAFPSRKSLAEVAFMLGNCEPQITGMITATMQDLVHFLFSVKTHREVLQAFLALLRRRGFTFYVWVREFQTNGSVHWHIFVSKTITDSGLSGELEFVDVELSRELSACFTRLYAKRVECPLCRAGLYAECEQLNGRCELGQAFRKMVDPHVDDFVGCVRAERLHSKEAAARYASKEGSKRFQKFAIDRRWIYDGGAWCRWSRGFEIPEYETVMLPANEVKRVKFKTPSGFEVDAAYRYQHGQGINRSIEDE